ncbi:5-formyltetrahydrofolate cyclo-ligase [Chitinophaga costaii]|uniref:5-formyltetrahydrofolate cyclo-ligase n=2 Tax=Chitinophaga costaii TaxID=1335309 RepID=A0A1C4G3C1_9BACT|nr:5-formyltetrahydrofolate cyclo-ligase [Chitinophaga costaii]SCC62646.1 5-formyltetrahydrofolate cyclo-ligase [Chitinophaga costaii]
MPTKTDLRATFLEKRLHLSPEAMATANNAIMAHCQALDYTGIRYLHLFLPIDDKKEVDTRPLAAWLREAHPEVNLVLSKTDMQSSQMLHYLWDEQTQFIQHRYGMTEPAGGMLVMPAAMDLVLVPLLAFDLQGHRVGYGKGMYDRFLQQCRPDVQIIGLSQFEPVESIDDAAEWDIRLRKAITPLAIYEFNS